MLNDAERLRLGELRGSVDLTDEEKQEMEALLRRAHESVHGSTDGIDFDVDSKQYTIIPLTDAAKMIYPSTLQPRDADQFKAAMSRITGNFRIRYIN
jgi:hypothetical protein